MASKGDIAFRGNVAMANKQDETMKLKVLSISTLTLLIGGLSIGGAFLVSGNGQAVTGLNLTHVKRANATNNWTLSLGDPTWTGINTYSLSSASVSGTGTSTDSIKTMTVKVSSGSVSVTSSHLPSDASVLTDVYGNHQTITLAFNSAKSASEMTTILQTAFVFDRLNQPNSQTSTDTSSQSINISFSTGTTNVSGNISELIDSDGIHHYYTFVAGTNVAFGTAYAAAKALSYNGLKGYLATITTASEEAVLDSVSSSAGWAGAVDFKSIETADADTYAGCGITTTYSPAVGKTRTQADYNANMDNFKWICGPEASVDGGTMNTYSRSQWDTSENVKQPSGWGGNSAEYLLGIHFAHGWNDYPGDGSAYPAGYFVEFSKYGKLGDGISFESYSNAVDTNHWGDWAWTSGHESTWTAVGEATRSNSATPSQAETWSIPVIPQPDETKTGSKIGDFWTEDAASFVAPTTSGTGSVTFTASGTHAENTYLTDEVATNYSFSIQKTLMQLATADPDATTVIKGLTPKATYSITLSDGSTVTITADANGEFNLATYNSGSLLGKTLQTMAHLGSNGARDSEIQTLPSTTIKLKYDKPTPTLSYGDNDTLTVGGLISGHTYLINGNSYTVGAGETSVNLPSSLLGNTSTALSVVDASADTTKYISSDADTSLNIAARPVAPSTSHFIVTAAASSNDKASISVPADSEYYDETTKAWVKGPKTASVTPGKGVRVRTSATGSLPASVETTVTTNPYKQPTPAPIIDYETGTFTKLDANASYTINGKVYTADGNGTLVIDVPLYGHTFDFIKNAVNGDGSDVASEAARVTVAPIPDAPAVGNYPVTEATSSSGKASVSVPSGSEYLDTATGKWVKGPTTVSVTPNTSVSVRVSATSTSPASKVTSVVTAPYKQPTPAATIDYEKGMFHNLDKNATYIIDGKEYTTDENGDLEIDIPLYGHTFSLIKKHVNNDGSDINSDAQTLTAIAMPDAPAASNYPVTEATSADGKASVVIPAGSEYLDTTTGKWVKGPTTISVTPGKSVDVRVSGTTSSPFSHTTTISTKSYQQPTPTASANYGSEQLKGFVPNATYTINGKSYTADADGNIPMDEAWYGTSLSIIKVHENGDGSDIDSTPETITVASRPAAPSSEDVQEVTSNADASESITVSDTQEYSLDGGVTWVKGTNNAIALNGSTSVMVRTAATADAPAGAVTTFTADPWALYKSPLAIGSYVLGFLLLLALIYRSIIYAAWHKKDKHKRLGFFVANNRWINVILFHTPYNKVELQAQEAAKEAAENNQEGK
jgi:hypothetical protein